MCRETKTSRVLAAFLTGRSFNRFEAERRLNDHCLHSTVSTIEKKYGLTISRGFETVRGYQGSPTRVCRYWVTHEERNRFAGARKSLEALSISDSRHKKGH